MQNSAIDPRDVRSNLVTGEIVSVNGDEYEVVRAWKRDYTTSNKTVVAISLWDRDSPDEISHKLKGEYQSDGGGDYVRSELVLKEKTTSGGPMRSPTWSEHAVRSLAYTTRERTRPLLDVSEGDLITFNGRDKPMEVLGVAEWEVGDRYTGTVWGRRVRVTCQGEWENAAEYRLYRYSEDMTMSQAEDDEYARVERPQVSSDGTKKFLKHNDLESVRIVRRGDEGDE